MKLKRASEQFTCPFLTPSFICRFDNVASNRIYHANDKTKETLRFISGRYWFNGVLDLSDAKNDEFQGRPGSPLARILCSKSLRSTKYIKMPFLSNFLDWHG